MKGELEGFGTLVDVRVGGALHDLVIVAFGRDPEVPGGLLDSPLVLHGAVFAVRVQDTDGHIMLHQFLDQSAGTV